MTNMTESNQTPYDHVVCTEFDGGEGILVDLNTKKYYQLNPTALLIWKGLEKGQSVNDIVTEVVAGYAVAPDHARRSVETLMSRLRSYKLINSL